MKKKLFLVTLIMGLVFLTGMQANAQTKYLIIPIESFDGAGSTEGWSRMPAIFIIPGFTMAYIWKLDDDGFLQAGFNLPNNANISGVSMIYWDNDAMDDITCSVKRHNIWNGTKETIFSCSSIGAATFMRNVGDFVPDVALGRWVNAKIYNFSVELYFPDADTVSFFPNKRVFGIRIQYVE